MATQPPPWIWIMTVSYYFLERVEEDSVVYEEGEVDEEEEEKDG